MPTVVKPAADVDVQRYTIKRLRKQYDGNDRWVQIGVCVVNKTDGTGTVYLNHQDEIWKLFKAGKGQD